MSAEILTERLFESLVSGDRPSARCVVDDAFREGASAETVINDLLWPAYDQIERFFRDDNMTTLAHHMGTRMLRVLVDQCALRLEQKPSRDRTVFAVCGPTDADELGAQITVDALEADGYAVNFAAGGIAPDEILNYAQQSKPDVLLLFASAPSDLPGTRWLIDTIREIGACDGTQIVVGGGVFNRADGLAEEIGADLWAETPLELRDVMASQPSHRAPATQRTVGRKARRAA